MGGGSKQQETTKPMIRSNLKNRWQPAVKAGLGVAAALLIASSGVWAADPAPIPAEKTNWVTTAAAALALSKGNSENFLVTLSLDTKRVWEKDDAAFGLSGGFGESTTADKYSKNTEFLQGFGQYNYRFTERFYVGLRGDGQYDGIAGVDYRFKITPLAGYYLIKTDKMSLATEVGPSVVFEKLQDEDARTYCAIRFAERFEYQLTATTKIWETLGYAPQVDDWVANYLLNFEAGIDTAITKHLSLRVVFQDLYASEPAPGKKNNDLRLLAGVAYKF
jgi:putative salt-induced outer membrane protein YdiY